MRRRYSIRYVHIFLLLMVSIGFAAGGCPASPESSQDVQTEKNAGSEAAEDGSKTEAPGESKTPSGDANSTKEESCEACHEEQARFQAYGGHSTVSCDTCHGVKADHVEAGTKPLMRGNDQCIECHELVEGPDARKMSEKEVLEHHLKFVEKKHVVKVKREKVKGRCIYCHNPHLGQ